MMIIFSVIKIIDAFLPFVEKQYKAAVLPHRFNQTDAMKVFFQDPLLPADSNINWGMDE